MAENADSLLAAIRDAFQGLTPAFGMHGTNEAVILLDCSETMVESYRNTTRIDLVIAALQEFLKAPLVRNGLPAADNRRAQYPHLNSRRKPASWQSSAVLEAAGAYRLVARLPLTLARTPLLQLQFNPPNVMFIEELGRHLAVSSIPELERSLKRDAGFWNVISIREPAVPRPVFLRYAKRVHEVIFEDRENIDPDLRGAPPRREHLASIFRFVDAHPDEPMLVHCLAGLSRSPAVALALIMRGLWKSDHKRGVHLKLTEKSVDLLLQIRPKSRPNVLVLQVGLELFMSADEARPLMVEMVNHPVLLENRFAKSRSQ